MVVHPSQVLSTQAHQSSTPASLTNEQMLAIVWETMKHLTDRRRFERYLAVALMLQRYQYAEIGGIIRRSVTTVCNAFRRTLGLRPGLSCWRTASVRSPAFPWASPPFDRGARTASGLRRHVQHSPRCRLSGEYELDLAAGPRLH